MLLDRAPYSRGKLYGRGGRGILVKRARNLHLPSKREQLQQDLLGFKRDDLGGQSFQDPGRVRGVRLYSIHDRWTLLK
ncbi:MAG: hypothetical protein R6U96_03835 [Promethearchaeia archaeon]